MKIVVVSRCLNCIFSPKKRWLNFFKIRSAVFSVTHTNKYLDTKVIIITILRSYFGTPHTREACQVFYKVCKTRLLNEREGESCRNFVTKLWTWRQEFNNLQIHKVNKVAADDRHDRMLKTRDILIAISCSLSTADTSLYYCIRDWNEISRKQSILL